MPKDRIDSLVPATEMTTVERRAALVSPDGCWSEWVSKVKFQLCNIICESMSTKRYDANHPRLNGKQDLLTTAIRLLCGVTICRESRK